MSDNITLALTALLLLGIYRASRWCISQGKRLWAMHRPLITTVGRRQASVDHAFMVNRRSQTQAYELLRIGFVPLIVNGEVIMYIANDNNGSDGICDVAVVEADGNVNYFTDWAYVTPHVIQSLNTDDVYYPKRGEWVIGNQRFYGDVVWHGFPIAITAIQPVAMSSQYDDPTEQWPTRYPYQ